MHLETAPVVYPADPDFRERAVALFRRQPFMAHIGARLRRLEPGFCEIELPFRAELGQQDDFLHAGLIGTLIDNTGGFAALSLFGEGENVLSVEYKVNLLRPVAAARVFGRAKVIRAGKKLTVAQAEVWQQGPDGREKLCATGTVTLMRMPAGAEGEPDSGAEDGAFG